MSLIRMNEIKGERITKSTALKTFVLQLPTLSIIFLKAPDDETAA